MRNKIQLKINLVTDKDFPTNFNLENLNKESRLSIAKELKGKEINWIISFERRSL